MAAGILENEKVFKINRELESDDGIKFFI